MASQVAPTQLTLHRDTLAYVFDIQFALRVGQKQRNMRREKSMLSVKVDEFSDEYLQYFEDMSKTNNGRLAICVLEEKLLGRIIKI